MSGLRRLAPGLACTALLIGVACAGPAPPVDRYFSLSVPDLERRFQPPPLAGTLRVKRPRADALTDGTHLLYRRLDNPAEVYRDPYQHWSDAPSLMLQDLLLHALDQVGLAGRVVPPGLRTPVDYTLSTRVMRLERLIETGSERVTVELQFSLVRESDRKLLFHERYEDGDTIQGTGTPAAIEAYGRALQRIFSRSLADLDAQLSRQAEPTAWLR